MYIIFSDEDGRAILKGKTKLKINKSSEIDIVQLFNRISEWSREELHDHDHDDS